MNGLRVTILTPVHHLFLSVSLKTLFFLHCLSCITISFSLVGFCIVGIVESWSSDCLDPGGSKLGAMWHLFLLG